MAEIIKLLSRQQSTQQHSLKMVSVREQEMR